MSQLRMLMAVAASGAAIWASGGESRKPVGEMDFSGTLERFALGNFKDRLTLTNGVFCGERCLQVLPREPGRNLDTSWSVVSPRFGVRPGAAFAIRTRAAGLTDMTDNYGGTCIRWYGEDGQPLTTVDVLGKTVNQQSNFGFRCDNEHWIETTEYGVVPAGATAADIKCGADNPDIGGSGSVMLAFVRYYEASDRAELVFDGDFDAPAVTAFSPDRPCADLAAPIIFRLSDRTAVDSKSLRFELDGQEVTDQLVKSKVADAWKYATPTNWEDGSLHTVRLTVADSLGNRMTEERVVYFSTVPVRHAKFTVRDDGIVMRNGQPFFPMSIFAFGGNQYNGGLEKGTAELVENGHTVISSYMRPISGWAAEKLFPELAAMAAKYDLPLCVQPARMGADSPDAAKRQKLFDEVCRAAILGRSLPAAGFWELGDDTASNRKPASVRKDDLAVKAIDGDVLTTQSDISKLRGRYRKYAHYTDVFRVEIYPMRAATPQPDEMAQVKRDMEVAYADLEQSGARNRSIWVIPQAFEGWGMWKRFPTYDELRCETLLAIACKARGVAYYTYASGEWGARVKPETWADLCKVTREVKALEADLVSRDAPKQPKVEIVDGPKLDPLGQFPVTALLKSTGRLIAATTAVDPVIVRFTLPDGGVFEWRFERNGVLVR